MIPALIAAAVVTAVVLSDDDDDKPSDDERDQKISQRVVSDKYVRDKMKKLGRKIRRS